MRCVEDICVFYRKKPTYNPQGLIKLEKPIIKKPDKTTDVYNRRSKESVHMYKNYPKNLIEFKRDYKKLHPTQKPVALCEYLIKTYTNEGELVLDNCAGSGTTLRACKNTKRNFIGFETNKDYYHTAVDRLST